MKHRFAHALPLVSLTLALSFVAGCGQVGAPQAPALSASNASRVKAEASARKETRAQAERRAKGYIKEFQGRQWRSINARTEMVMKIARTDADVAYDFLLDEVDGLQELRGEMAKVTRAQAEKYEEMLIEQLDEMTPDQNEVKARKAKAEALKIDLDELTVAEELATGGIQAQAARVGTRNRVLSAIQESKLYKTVSKAAKNTRARVKKFLGNLWKKLGFR